MAIETAGTYGEETKNIVRDIGRSLTEALGDQRETFWFMQRLSLVLQRGNAASILCGETEKQRFFKLKIFQNIGRSFSGSGS